MKVYVFQAALYCDPCGKLIANRFIESGKNDTGDSDDFPQGPYPNGGGEADSPQHCAACGDFLCNPLTKDGEDYVREACARNPHSDVSDEWASFYSYLWE